MIADDRDLYDFDSRAQLAHALLSATRVAAVVIGRLSVRDLRILDAEVAVAPGDAAPGRARILEQVSRTIAATVGVHRRDAPSDGDDIELTVEGGERTSVTWLGSGPCLVGLWRRRSEVTAFVALIRHRSLRVFPGWQRDVARIAMMYESDRIGWLRSDNGPPPSAVSEIIRHVAVALALVDTTRGLVFTNDAADRWLAGQDQLRAVDGRLAASEPELQRRLCAAVRVAAGGEPRRPTVLLLKGEAETGVPELVTCLPLTNLAAHALLIFGERPRDVAIADLLLDALGLTCAERRLARHLLVGRTLEDAARAANIKLSTARSYLKGIFAKTGVRRQSELVAVVGGLVPPVVAVPRTAAPRRAAALS